MSFNSTTYKNSYNTEAYDRINLMLPKGMKENLKSHIKVSGDRSVNAFIARAIATQIAKDKEQA